MKPPPKKIFLSNPMPQKNTLSSFLCLGYSSPQITTMWLIAPMGIIQGIYAKYFGLTLTTIAVVVLAAKLFDAITDPIIGHYADRYHNHTGSRKPLILVGGLLFIISSYYLYVPPENVGTVYFTAWFMAVYLAWTLYEIPHIAWAGELALSSTDKTKIYSFRNIAGYTGLLLFYMVPLLPFLQTREITPETLHISVVIAAIFMLPALYYCLKSTPDRVKPSVRSESPDFTSISGPAASKPTEKTKGWRLLVNSVVSNRPFLIFAGVYMFFGISSGMWHSLIFIYVDTYLMLGGQFAQVFLFAFVVGIVATPIWYKMSICMGKKATWALAMMFVISSFIYTGMLLPNETSLEQLIVLKTFQTLGFSCMTVISPSILSEIIDYGNWKHGTERTATYFSLYTFIGKVNLAIATALGLGIAGWYGFDATATSHDEESVYGLTLAISWLPTVFAIPAMIFILLTPINARRHGIIRQRLDARGGR